MRMDSHDEIKKGGVACNSQRPGAITVRFLVVALTLAVLFARAAANFAQSPNAPVAVRNATYPMTSPQTAHAFAPPIPGESQEKQGLVWLDNHRVMFVGFLPGDSGSKGIYIWNSVAQEVSRYSSHDKFCYADGYINAFGPSQVRDEAERSAVSPVRYGRLAEAKDGICDTRSGTGCPGPLNMSCKPAQYRGKAPFGADSAYVIELRTGDGVVVDPVSRRLVFDRAPKDIHAQREFFGRSLLLLGKKHPNGRSLQITALEELRGSAYSEFGKRYAFLTVRPRDGVPGHTTNWPQGRPQPVYLMTRDGDVESIQVPSRPDWNTIHLAMPAVPGLVFIGSGAYSNEWGGVFLYDKRDLLALDRGQAGPLAVSPDGCKVAYAMAKDYGKKPGPDYRYVKSINLCKEMK